jgi:MerR family transcriptional regulator, copper efflux regulator
MLISELSNCTGVSIDTIRFYEKQALLDETHYQRAANGYRHYSETAVQRLTLIKLGQAAGFTLNEMRQAIGAWETDELTPAQKVFYLCQKLEEMDRRLESLNAMRDYLKLKIEQMHVVA